MPRRQPVVHELVNESLTAYNFPVSGKIQLPECTPTTLEVIPGVDKPTTHTLVYNANMQLLALDQIEHSTEQIEQLNTDGIDIWLFEPLCGYYLDDPFAPHWTRHNVGYYSEFTPSVHHDETKFRAAELDSILAYAEKWGLTNITVHTGDYEVERFFTHYCDVLTLKCDDLFLRCLSIFDTFDVSAKTEITNRFISTCWRWSPARQLISSLLVTRDSELTWCFHTEPGVMEQAVWAGDMSDRLKAEYQTGLAVLNKQAPLAIDLDIQGATPCTQEENATYPREAGNHYFNPVTENRHPNPKLESAYRRTFLAVVSESRFAQTTANVSEKVYEAMKYKTPFILVGPPRSLEYLKSLGFMTFSDWWSEEYDEIEDHAARMEAILDIIDEIENKSHEELMQMYKQMMSVLEHNLKVYAANSRYKIVQPYIFKPLTLQVWHQGDQPLT